MPTRVVAIELGTVRLPEWHPRAADGTCPIRVFAVDHPDGMILFDTGPADDHELINEWYAPHVLPIREALQAHGLDDRDVAAIVNSHLHFDHCGQNRAFPDVAVWVQRDELAAAAEPAYTVPEWAEIEPGRRRELDGDESLADGVTVLSTPGHTPGHQSMRVHTGRGVELLVGQACYLCSDFEAVRVPEDNLHDGSWPTRPRRRSSGSPRWEPTWPTSATTGAPGRRPARATRLRASRPRTPPARHR